MTIKSEEWRDVTEFPEYYEVSNLGRVRSKDRLTYNNLTGGMSLHRGVILVGKVDRGGYHLYTLSVKGKNIYRTAHRLVANAFIPNPLDLPLVLHGRSGKSDNSTDNLRWGTNSENMRDRRLDGTDHELNKTHCPQGHPYEGANLVFDSGHRKCRECRRKRSRRYNAGTLKNMVIPDD